MYKLTKEGKAIIKTQDITKISKELEVFYNPVMKHNRDISVLILNSLNKKDMQICLPLAGSGIRGIRFLLELKKNKIKNITFNDYSKDAVRSIKKNLTLNKISSKNKIKIANQEANLFLLNSTGFDYIDLDPFGSPNKFLDSAAKRLSREGILAVTATDSAALTGTYTNACRRKYWADPLKNELMHEIGLRILIRKCQLIASQYEKALFPIFSYFKDHYFRIFFRCVKGKKEVDKIIKQHGNYETAGHLWLGKLWDEKLAKNIYKGSKKMEDKELTSFLKIIKEESKINTIGFYDLHKIVKKNKLKKIPKKEELIKKLKKASVTHFSGTGIRSNVKLKELLKKLS